MSKSSNELLSKLKTSLPKPADSNLFKAEVAQASDPEPIKSEVMTRSPRAPKLSVSLYQADMKRLDGIKDFMKAKGFRNLSDSEALRLACRSVEIGDDFIAVYVAMQQEDGRRNPGLRKTVAK